MKGKILIAEDNEENLYLVSFILKKSHYEVMVARDGMEAVKKAKEGKPDLILMDMQLPKMNGYEATKRIKAIPRLKNIPILALTAFAMKGDQEKILETGCNGYIEKPINRGVFLSEIEKCIRETKDEGRGTRDERRRTRDERRETRDERRGTRDDGRETRDERRIVQHPSLKRSEER